MPMFRSLTLLALCACFILPGCRPAVQGEGPLSRKSVPIDAFSKLELSMPAHVTLIVSDSLSLTIVAQENLMEYIEVHHEGSTVNLEAERSLKSDKPVEFIFTCPAPEELEVNGSGSISVLNRFRTGSLVLNINGSGDIRANTNADQIETQINGSGDVYLSGSADEHKVEINGSGKLKAPDLLTDRYKISIHGSGDCYVHALSKLSANITGSGNVRYSGNPDVKSDITGSGNISRKD